MVNAGGFQGYAFEDVLAGDLEVIEDLESANRFIKLFKQGF